MKPLHRLKNSAPGAMALSRVLICPAVVYLFWESRTLPAYLLFMAAALTYYVERVVGGPRATGLDFVVDGACDKIWSITLFTFLMVRGACPPWFVGLLITITLLQCSAYLFLRLPRANARLAFGPVPLGRRNQALQMLCIALSLIQLTVAGSSAEPTFTLSVVRAAMFGSLALLQIVVFYRYFSRFRPLLIPDFRLQTAN
jgi:phosphatidylglycerophosphate synthase